MKTNSHNHNTILQMQNSVTSFLWIPLKYKYTVHISTHIMYIYIYMHNKAFISSIAYTCYNYIRIFSPNRCLLLSQTKNTCPFLGGFTKKNNPQPPTPKTKIIEAKPPQPHQDRWRSPLPLVLVLSWPQIAKSPPFIWEWRSCAIDPFTREYTLPKTNSKST